MVSTHYFIFHIYDLQVYNTLNTSIFLGKEAWLLNALVDSFAVSHSEKCLEILACVNEPHDKV